MNYIHPTTYIHILIIFVPIKSYKYPLGIPWVGYTHPQQIRSTKELDPPCVSALTLPKNHVFFCWRCCWNCPSDCLMGCVGVYNKYKKYNIYDEDNQYNQYKIYIKYI